MQLTAGWDISGIVTELRELTSEKSRDWRAYIATIASIGCMFELQLTPQQFQQMGQGQNVRCRGRFDESRGKLRLVVEKVEQLSKAGVV